MMLDLSAKLPYEESLKLYSASGMAELEIIEQEIIEWTNSPKRKDMLQGTAYYLGDHDILRRKIEAINAQGELEELKNVPNNKRVDNRYALLVDQKVNYLLSNPFAVQTDSDEYQKTLGKVFSHRFRLNLSNTGKDSFNCGIGWMYFYYEDGEVKTRKFPAWEIIPFWKDEDHTILDMIVRVYSIEAYEGKTKKDVTKVKVYKEHGVYGYILKGSRLIVDIEEEFLPYMRQKLASGDSVVNFNKIPLVAFKYNQEEFPLLNRVKSLQDAMNKILSTFENNLDQDARNTILVLVNYEGQNLEEFRQNMNVFGAIKVSSADGINGDVKTLQIEVNPENYKSILEILKKAIISNGRGYDAKDERMANNPNQMNIQSMYSEIDLDADMMELQYQTSMEEVLKIVNLFFSKEGKKEFSSENVDIIFNRDILVNESTAIEDIAKSVGILSKETLVAQHPYVTDIQAELKRIEEEEEKNIEKMSSYRGVFNEGEGNE